MKTNHLQAMLALNASNITDLNILVCSYKDTTAYHRHEGNVSLALHYAAQASKVGSKLKKAVNLQKAMLAELKAVYREARISRKIAEVEYLRGERFARNEYKTSYETEKHLDSVLALLVPKKADSRIAA